MTMESEKGSRWNKAKGNLKEGIGKLTGDRSLRREGQKDESVGRLQEKQEKGYRLREGDIRSEVDKSERGF